MHSLTKSYLTALRQCPKPLWFEVYRRNEAVNATDTTRRMAEGDKIGEIARLLSNPNGDGRLIDIKAQGVDEAIRTTADILPDRQPIFEAGFRAYSDCITQPSIQTYSSLTYRQFTNR